MPRVMRRVNCMKCPLDEICDFSASEDLAVDKDGYVWVKEPIDLDTVDYAHNNCPLRKLLDSAIRIKEL